MDSQHQRRCRNREQKSQDSMNNELPIVKISRKNKKNKEKLITCKFSKLLIFIHKTITNHTCSHTFTLWHDLNLITVNPSITTTNNQFLLFFAIQHFARFIFACIWQEFSRNQKSCISFKNLPSGFSIGNKERKKTSLSPHIQRKGQSQFKARQRLNTSLAE